MKFFVSIGAILLLFVGVGLYFYFKTGNTFGLTSTFLSRPLISVSSTNFDGGGEIPKDFTCDGANNNPQFLLDRVNPDAKSLVFIMEDVDTKPNFTHWILFNIDPKTLSIDRPSDLAGASIGTNDFGKMEYDGPCPSSGSVHKYYFRLYALDTVLSLPDGAKRNDIDLAMKNHIIGRGEIFGIYSR